MEMGLFLSSKVIPGDHEPQLYMELLSYSQFVVVKSE